MLDRRGKRAAYRPLPPRRLRRAVQRQGMVLGARRRGPAEASFVGTSVGEDRDAGSGDPLDREPFGSLSIDRVGSGLDSRELLVLLAGLAVFVAAIARVRRRI